MRAAAVLAFASLCIAIDPAAAHDNTGARLIACAPMTFEKAVQCLHDDLPGQTRAGLLAPDGPTIAHMGLGLFLRNNWGLWKHGPLAVSLIAHGFRHPDDMSAAIIEAYLAREKGQTFDLQRTIADDAAFWDQQGKK